METEHLESIRDFLRAVYHPEQLPAVRTLADRHLSPDILRIVQCEVRKRRAPIEFGIDSRGWVLLGPVGNSRPYPLPKRDDALRFAYAVIEAGRAAPSIIRCEDWNKSPGAMREALKRTRENWAEKFYPPLAVVLKGITISDSGRAKYRGSTEVSLLPNVS